MDSSASRATSKAKGLSAIAIIALIFLIIFIDLKRRAAVKQMEQMSVRLEQLSTGQSNQAQNRETAQRIIAEVRKLYALPEGTEPTVAAIVDVNELRKRNSFYGKAENGDYLIVTTDRAILYDPDRNVILDIVPVQIQPAGGQQPAPPNQ